MVLISSLERLNVMEKGWRHKGRCHRQIERNYKVRKGGGKGGCKGGGQRRKKRGGGGEEEKNGGRKEKKNITMKKEKPT